MESADREFVESAQKLRHATAADPIGRDHREVLAGDPIHCGDTPPTPKAAAAIASSDATLNGRVRVGAEVADRRGDGLSPSD